MPSISPDTPIRLEPGAPKVEQQEARPLEGQVGQVATKTIEEASQRDRSALEDSLPKREISLCDASKGAPKKTNEAYGRSVGQRPSGIELHRAKMEADLARIDRRMGKIQGGQGSFQIQGLGTSANPVGRLQEELFVPLDDAKKLESQNKALSSSKNLQLELRAVTQKMFSGQPPAGRELIQKKFAMYVGKPETTKVGRQWQEPTVEQYLKQIIARMEEDKDDVLEDPVQKQTAQALIEAFSELGKSATLEGVSKQVEKDGVVSNLRAELTRSDDPATINALSQEIREVNALPGRFVAVDSLPQSNRGIMTRNLPSFVSSMDVLQRNNFKPEIDKELRLIASGKSARDVGAGENPRFADQPGFAFKTGNENHREVLAGRMADTLGVQRYLTPKSEVTLKSGKLGNRASPEGLASKWLAEGTPFHKDALFHYTEQKALMVHKEANGEEVTQEDKDKLARLREELQSDKPGIPNRTSVNIQAWLDLATCSYDSHADQYMVIDGEVHCFDFARFGAPSESYVDSDGNLMVTFRSTFIDHPDCSEGIPKEVIAVILQADPNQIEATLAQRGLLGTREEFQKWEEGIHTAAKVFVNIDGEISEAEIDALANRFGVEVSKPLNEKDKALLKHHLKNEYAQLKKESFSKVHPDALSKMKERITAAQDYVNTCQQTGETPTMEGAYQAMMPSVATLGKMYEKYGGTDPGNRLAINKVNNMVGPHKLNLWFEENRGKMTAEDKQACQEALMALQASACLHGNLCTTMDLGD